ncbi:non-ribosomal peptide synthetase [Chitinophagaceae bacterium LWZ2-11]
MAHNDLKYNLRAVDFNPFAGEEIKLVAPITEPQAEIWASCLVGGDEANCAYNESVSLLLKGTLDRVLLERSLYLLASRHEAMRAVFSPAGNCIIILAESSLTINFQDLSLKNKTERDNYITRFFRQDAQTPFDLINGPLFRIFLFKLKEKEYYLRITAHHIVCDGWSIGIILQDLGKLYSALTQQQTPVLPNADLFSTYAIQQNVFRETAAYKAIENYWVEQYRDIPQLNLPIDHIRPAVRTYKSNRVDRKIDITLIDAVKKLGAATGAGFVTTLLAAFEIYIARLTGQEDIVLAFPAAGQPFANNHNLVGHCVNLLPIRSRSRKNISFVEYLKERRSAILDAYEYRPFTLGSLLKKLAVPRDASRMPITPVMFNTDMGMDDGVKFAGLTHQLISNPRMYETFELFVNITDWEGGVNMEWSYNTQLFNEGAIERMAADFEHLLQGLINAPEQKIKNISNYYSVDELNKKLLEWNNTSVPYPKHLNLTDLISNAAKEYAGNIAVQYGGTTVTYQQLEILSNKFARLLSDNNVHPGDTVGLAIDRSADMVIALLGILKAGAAYVPLDPAYPIDRVNFMLKDSSAKLLITSGKYKGRFKTDTPELLLEEMLPALSEYAEDALDVRVTGSNPVYILYTSGSTGLPKGVQIKHSNLVNFLCSMQKFPGITSSDKLLAVTTFSFDIAGLEIYLPLISGAAVFIVDAETAKDGSVLLQTIKREGITIMQATPATWRVMLESGWNEVLPLKALCGGEALSVDLAQKLSERCEALFNMYGPTETTIWSTVKKILPDTDIITVGRPIDNTQVYILDEDLDLLSPDVIGEIYIGGAGVADGYLNRVELTAEKFIDDPFRPGNKMYRTGDLGKFTPSGEIVCLGRIDHQIKVRGFRIEAGDIEHALLNQPDVKDAVVIARKESTGSNTLAAYVIAADETTSEYEKIKAWCIAIKATLPDYMMPADFIILPEFPITPAGKVDRNALALQKSVKINNTGFVAPRTDVEKMVADIWKEHLELDNISVYDNFFELGGHSLIAVKVMNDIEKQTGKHLPLSGLFTYPTIEQLTLLLAMDGRSVTWDSLVPIKPTGTKMPLYIVHGAGLHVLLFNTLAANMDADQPIYGLQAKGMNEIDEPLDNMQDIAAHYVAEIIAQNPTGPYALAGYSFGGIIAFEMTKQLEAMGKEVKMLAMFDTYAYRSDKFDPFLSKIFNRTLFFFKQLLYSIFLLFKDPKRTIEYKTEMIKRRVVKAYWRIRYGREHERQGFMGYSHKIDRMNHHAERNYKLSPYSVRVELFRAKKRTFYMEDFDNLGWKPYALKGVNIHEIPGEHNYIFAPPNNIAFAGVLQKCLDKAAKK